ncbi:hypothetical protein [Streptomyces flaveolus]
MSAQTYLAYDYPLLGAFRTMLMALCLMQRGGNLYDLSGERQSR